MDQDDRAVYIYVLSESDTGQVRYVGSTVNPDERLKGHVGRSTSTQVQAWVRELSRRGAAPVMRVIDTVPAERRDVVERRWIRRMERRTALVNTRWVGKEQHRWRQSLLPTPSPLPDRAATVPVLVRLTPAMLALIKQTETVIGLDVTGYVRRAVWDSLKADGFAAVPREDDRVREAIAD